MNYETDKIIFVCFPPGAGGKFLINCLGLSDGAVLQHQNYIDYTKAQKKKYLWDSIIGHDKDTKWKDIGLGCNQLLGDLALNDTLEHGAILGKLEVGLPFNNVGIQLSNQTTKDFFYVCHDEDTRQSNVKVFPNAKQIHFVDAEKFLKARPEYSWVKDVSWNDTSDMTWHTDWYESIDQTVWGIERMYSLLEYNDFESVKDFIKNYYHIWIQKIR